MSQTACRACASSGLETVLSLGIVPLANSLVTAEELNEPEARYPLELALCPDCALVQLTESVSPEDLFSSYVYFSSYSSTAVARAAELSERMQREKRLGADSLVVELASNDGYLLQHYVKAGIPVLGIDPAANVAKTAREKGVPTLCEFFDEKVAKRLCDSGRRADVVHANNVLAHVPDLNSFVRGMATVLSDQGTVVVETPYLMDLVENLEFDTIYHEHLFYYSLRSLKGVFESNGLRVTDVERIPIHGGSLRVFACRDRTASVSPAVGDLLEKEKEAGAWSSSYFLNFGEKIQQLGLELRDMLASLKSEGKRIAGYGAAAKGAILLNVFGIGPETLDFVADKSPHKHEKYMPGVRIPVGAPERLLDEMPDYVLLLAWNFEEEILSQQAEYRRRGGGFIIPVPVPRVV